MQHSILIYTLVRIKIKKTLNVRQLHLVQNPGRFVISSLFPALYPLHRALQAAAPTSIPSPPRTHPMADRPKIDLHPARDPPTPPEPSGNPSIHPRPLTTPLSTHTYLLSPRNSIIPLRVAVLHRLTPTMPATMRTLPADSTLTPSIDTKYSTASPPTLITRFPRHPDIPPTLRNPIFPLQPQPHTIRPLLQRPKPNLPSTASAPLDPRPTSIPRR